MNPTTLAAGIALQWDQEIVPQLTDYIRIPEQVAACSTRTGPSTATWTSAVRADGILGQGAADQAGHDGWRSCACAGRTPLIYHRRYPATDASVDGYTVLLYGHLDKQPEMTGWAAQATARGSRCYEKATNCMVAAVPTMAMRSSARVVGDRWRCRRRTFRTRAASCMIEACEESGSYDLPAYLAALLPRMGNVDFVIGLDSGCGDYERLWATTSLRGLVGGTLTVEVLTEGVHSGDASGIVPSSFRIARKLLDRLEDATTGRVLPAAFHAPIPPERVEQAGRAAQILGATVIDKYPFKDATQPMVVDRAEALLNRTWRPALSVTGADGMPPIANAGNVLRPQTSLKLSLRLPPTIDGEEASRTLKQLLEAEPPYGARVHLDHENGATGWNAPPTAVWLTQAIDEASVRFYDKPAAAMGEGGTIPFMAMLGKHFPDAQFLITGVLGPHANAHGPNEFLHVPYAKKLTACVAHVLAAHR